MDGNNELSRRGFLGSAILTPAWLAAATPPRDANCIVLWLTGGPSHLDTFDPKPDAPSNVRGPFRPIRTNVPGIALSENLPHLAQRADRFALLRGVHHDAAPVHETGMQLIQTGQLSRDGDEAPHLGAMLSAQRGVTWAIVPGPLGATGISVSHGQTPGYLGPVHAARLIPKLPLAERYGNNPFGRSCLAARQLVESGTRLVTVNMFPTVFNETTWDCHADGGSLATTLDDYKRTLCPMLDTALSALLDDLKERGMLDNTLVVATGEFGRTPFLNSRGGRDHWPGVWTVLMAGAGVQGGRVIGSSDALGGEPKDHPTTAAEVFSLIARAVGVDDVRHREKR